MIEQISQSRTEVSKFDQPNHLSCTASTLSVADQIDVVVLGVLGVEVAGAVSDSATVSPSAQSEELGS